MFGLAFVLLLSCNIFANHVSVYIGCNDGSVNATAYGSTSSPFAHIEMDLQIQGPSYNTYTSDSGTSYVSITGSNGFEYDSFYTATACAYVEDDDGGWYGCDTETCVTPIEPTKW